MKVYHLANLYHFYLLCNSRFCSCSFFTTETPFFYSFADAVLSTDKPREVSQPFFNSISNSSSHFQSIFHPKDSKLLRQTLIAMIGCSSSSQNGRKYSGTKQLTP